MSQERQEIPGLVTLMTVARGAAVELWQRELEAVLANIQDVNTPATAKRQIVLTVTLVPDDRREMVALAVDCSGKLAPALPAVGSAWLSRRDGVPIAVANDPAQLTLPGMEVPSQIQERGKAFVVDQATGEVLWEAKPGAVAYEGNVIRLRKEGGGA